MPLSTSLQNKRGVALLYLVILFTLLGVLVSFGARKFGALVTQGKISEAKSGLERNVQMIVAWSVKNGRLPTSTEYPGVFGSAPLDAWGKPVVFAYYSSLTKTSTGGLCGRTSSSITSDGQDVAFLLISGGDDMSINSTPKTDGFFNGVLNGLLPEDLYRIVTLKELQAQASCFGTTQGSLRIVNNELPSACTPQKYVATIFGSGGVEPLSYSFYPLPAWLSPTGGAFATLSGNTLTAVQPSYTIDVTVTDKAGSAVKRSYVLKVTGPCN